MTVFCLSGLTALGRLLPIAKGNRVHLKYADTIILNTEIREKGTDLFICHQPRRNEKMILPLFH